MDPVPLSWACAGTLIAGISRESQDCFPAIPHPLDSTFEMHRRGDVETGSRDKVLGGGRHRCESNARKYRGAHRVHPRGKCLD
jgi:hypothetical protein